MITSTDEDAARALDERLRTLLPADYEASFEELAPVPMRSAGLKYDAHGQVAWNEIWGSFCDLALAGGPPHKGALLEPGREHDITVHGDRYREVVDEIRRGIMLVTGMTAEPSPRAGWIRTTCPSETMAGWLLRAITIENVSVRAELNALDLPAAPSYRLDKEIKNVVTVIAKTCHYWIGHMRPGQRLDIADLFAEMDHEAPLVAPWTVGDPGEERLAELAATMIARIVEKTGLAAARYHYRGWLGVQCPNVRGGIWMMRFLVAMNVLARRENTLLFIPMNPTVDPDGELVLGALERAHRTATLRGAI
jgi:hypothetical protein